MNTRRMPAEWEPHRATWISWPHLKEDWPGKFAAIPWVFAEIVRLLSRSEHVEILCRDRTLFENARKTLQLANVSEGFTLHICRSDRGWLRDSAPTMVFDGDTPRWVRRDFNGWARYDNHTEDKKIPDTVAALSGIALETATLPDGAPFVLEGGAIEVNGAGLLLCTEECLLSDVQQRNPGLNAAGYEQLFEQYLGIEKTLWLAGSCEGDDTHGHIDDVARFVGPRTVALALEADSTKPNYDVSQENLARLQAFRFSDGAPLKIVKLPFPEPIIFEEELLPASYANFYIGNKVVLLPVFNDLNDSYACELLQSHFPDRKVIGVFSRDLILGLGSFHCLTQQEPLITI